MLLVKGMSSVDHIVCPHAHIIPAAATWSSKHTFSGGYKSVQGSLPEGVPILTNLVSIDSKLKNKDGHDIFKT
jgi:hypothetical protein